MRRTRQTILALVAASLASPALAGGFAPAVVEPVVVIPDAVTPRSSAGVLVPLAILAILVGVAVSRDDDDDDTDDDNSTPDLVTEEVCDFPPPQAES